jgi:glycosyltransferase involved in cell wall biosynthesis
MERMHNIPIRIAYLVSHPIQYQAPLLRKIAKIPEIDLTVLFRTDISAKVFNDNSFGRKIEWDVDLLYGYKHDFLPSLGSKDKFTYGRPFNYGIWRRMKKGKYHFLWVHGYSPILNVYAIIIAKILGMKVLIRDEATETSKKRGEFKKIIKKLFFKVLNLFVDGFLCIGTMNKQYYTANGVSPKKLFDMAYTVDNHYFQKKRASFYAKDNYLRKSLNLSPERPVILFASKMSGRKRAIDLLEAYNLIRKSIVPKPYLLFIGDGEKRAELENRIKQLCLAEDVLVLGFKNQGELPRFYHLCSVFVLPSLQEPWGLVINEAMSAGRAVIASDQVGSAYDLIIQGKNGFIFKAGDIHALADALLETLSEPNRCEQMGKASLEMISGWGFDRNINSIRKTVDTIIYERV